MRVMHVIRVMRSATLSAYHHGSECYVCYECYTCYESYGTHRSLLINFVLGVIHVIRVIHVMTSAPFHPIVIVMSGVLRVLGMIYTF